MPATHYTSLSLSYNPRVVAIIDATIRPNPIFRSLYQHYQENDFCDVVIANSAPEPIEVTVGIFLPKIMSVPHQETILLPPQSNEKYAFKVTFDTDIFNKREAYFDNFVTPAIKVSYTRNRKEQSGEKQLERVYVAGKGRLSWNVPGMAAAFVTTEDLAIAGMARGLVQRYNVLLGAKFNRSNIGKAVLIFDAMGAYRIRYQADQKTPFSRDSDDKTIFDTVQYPSELLFKGEGVETKIGDCDDLTVLYASLLENLSIDTAFLEANDPGKGHIYLMFDSGISPENAEDHFLSSAEYVVWQGRVWIPIETTMFGFTFADAWRNGAAEYKRLKVRKLIDEVYVQQWLQTYKPASLPPTNVTLPTAGEMDSLLFRDLDYFDQRVDQIALGSATSLDTPDGAYDAGVAYLRINHLEKALRMFDKALEMRSDHFDAINAKGVVLTHQGQYDEALALYDRATAIAPDETGYRVNISLIYYLKGDRKKADTLYQQIVSQDDAYDGLLDFLAEVGSADEHYRIAVSYMQQEEYDRAIERLDQALRADPEMGEAYNTKAVILSNKGNYEEAYALLEKAEVQLPTHPGIRLNMAIVRYLQGRRHEAAVIYQQVIDTDDRYNGFLDFLLEEE